MLSDMRDDAEVRLQLFTREQLRRRLKAQAAEQGLDMSELGAVVLDYGLGLIAAGKPPAALAGMIRQVKADRSADARSAART
jgi:hypothetical protein